MTIIRVIDVETDGLPPDARIVEVATVDLESLDRIVDGDGRPQWKRGRMWRSFVNPGRPIPPQLSAIHHITDEMVADAPRWPITGNDSPAGMIEEGLPDYFAAHNSRFEDAVLRASGTALGTWICTFKCAVSAWPDAPAHGNQALRYWLELKLADEAGPPHRALGDAYVTAAILRRLLTANTVDQLTAVSQVPALLPRFHFGEHSGKPIADVPTSYLSWIVEKSRGPWDEDVLFTAKRHLADRRQIARSRSPV